MYADKLGYGSIGNTAMQPPWGRIDAMQQACTSVAPSTETRIAREVPDQMERLEKAVCFAEESLRELMARLGDVLRPTGPEQCTAGTGIAPGPATAHGGHLYHLGTRAGNIGQDIQDLLRRLEV